MSRPMRYLKDSNIMLRREFVVFEAVSIYEIAEVSLCGIALSSEFKFKYLAHWATEDNDNYDVEREHGSLAVRCNMLAGSCTLY